MSDDKRKNIFEKLAVNNARTAEADGNPAVEPVAAVNPSPALPESPKQSRRAAKKEETVKGKRTNPDYCQANAYVPKKLRRAVEKALLDVEGLDYSQLVEELLKKWLKSRGVSE